MGDIQKAVEIIKNGGVVIFPTDTVYGIGCDPYNEDAVHKIYEIKNRPERRALPVLVSKKIRDDLLESNIDWKAKGLIEKYWPGALTIIIEKNNLPFNIPRFVTSGESSVGLRMPNNSIALELIEACGGMLAATSANISATDDTNDPSKLNIEADYILDGGILGSGKASTVIKISDGVIKILRQGNIEIN